MYLHVLKIYIKKKIRPPARKKNVHVSRTTHLLQCGLMRKKLSKFVDTMDLNEGDQFRPHTGRGRCTVRHTTSRRRSSEGGATLRRSAGPAPLARAAGPSATRHHWRWRCSYHRRGSGQKGSRTHVFGKRLEKRLPLLDEVQHHGRVGEGNTEQERRRKKKKRRKKQPTGSIHGIQ